MNAADWQAAAEVLGLLVVVGNILGGLFIYRMQASFVTRAEHNKMSERMDDADERVDLMDKAMGRLVTTEQVAGLYDRIGTVERQGAKMLGEMTGIHDQLASANNMLQMLVRNEIEGGRKS